MRFLLSRADYDRLSPLLLSALRPYSAPRLDQAGDEYVAALKTLTTGSLDLTVLSYDEDPATSSLRRMKFRAEFTAPRDFGFAPELKPKPATCPGPFGH